LVEQGGTSRIEVRVAVDISKTVQKNFDAMKEATNHNIAGLTFFPLSLILSCVRQLLHLHLLDSETFSNPASSL
jgi:hypothetical protein